MGHNIFGGDIATPDHSLATLLSLPVSVGYYYGNMRYYVHVVKRWMRVMFAHAGMKELKKAPNEFET